MSALTFVLLFQIMYFLVLTFQDWKIELELIQEDISAWIFLSFTGGFSFLYVMLTSASLFLYPSPIILILLFARSIWVILGEIFGDKPGDKPISLIEGILLQVLFWIFVSKFNAGVFDVKYGIPVGEEETRWALLIQAFYFYMKFFSINPVLKKAQWKIEFERFERQPMIVIGDNVMGALTFLPLLVTILSMMFLPNSWFFILLGVNATLNAAFIFYFIFIWYLLIFDVSYFAITIYVAIVMLNIVGVSKVKYDNSSYNEYKSMNPELDGVESASIKKDLTIQIISSIASIITVIFIVFSGSVGKFQAISSNSNMSVPALASSDLLTSIWFLLLKLVIMLILIIGILRLLRVLLEDFLQTAKIEDILTKVIISVVSGVLVTSIVYLLFGDTSTASIPGLLVSVGVYFLNKYQS